MNSQTEFQVNYRDGTDWRNVETERARHVLGGYYRNADGLLDDMRHDRGELSIYVIGAMYRANPDYKPEQANDTDGPQATQQPLA